MIQTINYNYNYNEYYTIINNCIILKKFCYAEYEGKVFQRYEIIEINKSREITIINNLEKITLKF